MFFGIGIGDITLGIKGAFHLYESIHDFPEEREELKRNLKYWEKTLESVDRTICNSRLSTQAEQLAREQLSESFIMLKELEKGYGRISDGNRVGWVRWEFSGKRKIAKAIQNLERGRGILDSLLLSCIA